MLVFNVLSRVNGIRIFPYRRGPPLHFSLIFLSQNNNKKIRASLQYDKKTTKIDKKRVQNRKRRDLNDGNGGGKSESQHLILPNILSFQCVYSNQNKQNNVKKKNVFPGKRDKIYSLAGYRLKLSAHFMRFYSVMPI